jgi:ribosomal protein S18 acetylase RimI-like enzyme
VTHPVDLADRTIAPVLARLQHRSSIAGYGHIFPPEAPPPTHEELVALWEHWLGPDWDQGRRAFVVRADDEVVGVVLSGPDPVRPEFGHLARLYVDPERWREGIGRALYRAAMDDMRSAGYPAATLWVLERNDKARAWYERLGWALTGIRKTVYEPTGIDDVQYRITLR